MAAILAHIHILQQHLPGLVFPNAKAHQCMDLLMITGFEIKKKKIKQVLLFPFHFSQYCVHS